MCEKGRIQPSQDASEATVMRSHLRREAQPWCTIRTSLKVSQEPCQCAEAAVLNDCTQAVDVPAEDAHAGSTGKRMHQRIYQCTKIFAHARRSIWSTARTLSGMSRVQTRVSVMPDLCSTWCCGVPVSAQSSVRACTTSASQTAFRVRSGMTRDPAQLFSLASRGIALALRQRHTGMPASHYLHFSSAAVVALTWWPEQTQRICRPWSTAMRACSSAGALCLRVGSVGQGLI